MASYLFNSLFRRRPTQPAEIPHFPYKITENPYRCKRTWPPDFTQLSPKHQFRLERRYKRRSKLKWARPTWTKITKLGQWGTILFIAVYGVVALKVDDQGRTLVQAMRGDFEDGGKSLEAGMRRTKREQQAQAQAQAHQAQAQGT